MTLVQQIHRSAPLWGTSQLGALDPLAEALFEDPATGILIVNCAGQIVRANSCLRAMLAGLGDSLARDAPAETILALPDRERGRAALQAGLLGIAPATALRVQLLTAGDQAARCAAISMAPLRDTDGAIGGLVLRLADLSVERRLGAQSAHNQKLLAVGQLAGGIAHDFNNLLTTISGAADAMRERPGFDIETLEDVRQIHDSVDRGAALVRQLLAFGRRQPLAARMVAVNEAVRHLAAMLVRVLGEKVRLDLALEEPGRSVRVDPTQLNRVLINLAVNARDAMPEGGTLTLRTGHRTLHRAGVPGGESAPPGRYVEIEVADTGRGIAPEILARVFEPFFTTRREHGGSGLGLSTVHGIVRQSGGFVVAESIVGIGTRMRIWLPLEAEETDQVIGSIAQPAPPAVTPIADMVAPRPRLVLLVEDEDPIRRLAERALSRAGWQVLQADSAEAALTSLPQPGDSSVPPAVLVSDVVLPGMDGTELVRKIRETWPGLPAVLVSGYADSALPGDLAGEGTVFLPKPYRLKELVAWVERAALGET